MKLQLTHLRMTDMSCIPHPHYDLCTDEPEPMGIACILTDAKGAQLIRGWIKEHNKNEDRRKTNG